MEKSRKLEFFPKTEPAFGLSESAESDPLKEPDPPPRRAFALSIE
jgi:hypothetical protein